MHPSHQYGATERPSPADRLTEWLLMHWPMSTLAVLTLLVMGPTLRAYWPWPVLVTAVAIDLLLRTARRRRTKHAGVA